MLRFNRSSHRYRAIRYDQAALRARIRELAAARVRYGYFRIYTCSDVKAGRSITSGVYRLYRQEGSACGLDGQGAA